MDIKQFTPNRLGAFTALQFLVVAFGVFFFDSRGRHEIATILTFAMMGINVGIVAVGHYNDILDPNYKIGDALVPQALDFQRQALGYVLFSYVTIFIGLGLLLSVALRGIINPESSEGWFGKISPVNGGYNIATLPLQLATLVWILAHVGSLYHFESVSMADKLGIFYEEGYHGHFGFWGAFFTGSRSNDCCWHGIRAMVYSLDVHWFNVVALPSLIMV